MTNLVFAKRLIKAARMLLASLHPNEVKTLIKQYCGDKYALFGDSVSNITLIDRYGNKLQCFHNFYLIKATGEHTCLGHNTYHSEYPTHKEQDDCNDYLVGLIDKAEQHLGDKPTNLTGDRLIHAVLAKLEAAKSFHPELKYLVDQLENNDAELRQFPQKDAIDFVNNNNLQQAFNTLVRNKNLQQQEQQPPPKLKSNTSIATKRRIAKNPSTHPDTLSDLADDPDTSVKRCVAQNPSTPPDTLANLAKNTDTWVKLWVAQNPSTHPDTLAKLADDTNEYVRRGVAKNPSTHPDTLAKLADDTDPSVKRNVAENPSTHPDTLAKLADDTDPDVRANVAINPSTHPDVLAKLADDPDDFVRRGVALNPSTHPTVLAKLAKNTDPWVRQNVSHNKHAPMSLVRQLDPDHPKLRTIQ